MITLIQQRKSVNSMPKSITIGDFKYCVSFSVGLDRHCRSMVILTDNSANNKLEITQLDYTY